MKPSKRTNSTLVTIPFIASLAALLVAVPIRVYQYLKLINPTTGFFDETDFSIFVLYGIIALAMLICIVISYINHKSLQPVAIGKNSKAFLAVSLLMALGTAIDCVSLIAEFSDLADKAPINISREFLFEYISSQGGTLTLIEAVFAAISAFYFVLSGLSSINDNDGKPKFKILALSPVVWCVFRLLYRFKRTIAFINVSDLFIELFSIVMAMVFFLALAQIRSKIDADSIFWKIYAYGLPAAVLALVCFVPRLILVVTGNSDMINPLHSLRISDLTFAVYAIYICVSATKAEPRRISE
ncbi:MAG: hypothetical protein IK955_01460 [Clostridia bacterium]|nr:hypothetical protein [Clostridia bacterium]